MISEEHGGKQISELVSHLMQTYSTIKTSTNPSSISGWAAAGEIRAEYFQGIASLGMSIWMGDMASTKRHTHYAHLSGGRHGKHNLRRVISNLLRLRACQSGGATWQASPALSVFKIITFSGISIWWGGVASRQAVKRNGRQAFRRNGNSNYIPYDWNQKDIQHTSRHNRYVSTRHKSGLRWRSHPCVTGSPQLRIQFTN